MPLEVKWTSRKEREEAETLWWQWWGEAGVGKEDFAAAAEGDDDGCDEGNVGIRKEGRRLAEWAERGAEKKRVDGGMG